MNTYFYALHDKGMKVWNIPFSTPVPPTDIKEAYRRQFFYEADKAEEQHLYSKDLYFVGTFNEETGDFVVAKDFVCELVEVLPIRKLKEVANG